MKNQFWFFILIALGKTMSSCSEVDKLEGVEARIASKQPNLTLVYEFENMSIEDKRATYNLLSPYEKHLFWVRHIKDFSVANKLNENQKELIEMLIKRLEGDVFLGINNNGFNSFLQETFFPLAKKLFTKQQLKEIGYPRNGSMQISSARHEMTEATCNCATSSLIIDDCGSGQSCYPVACTGGGNNCGFMWTDECDMGCR
jgi:hypothetical protein